MVETLSADSFFAILNYKRWFLYIVLPERRRMKNDKTKNAGQQHEDAVLKLSAQFFAAEIFPYLKIEGKVVGIAPTELVQVEIYRQYQDYNFVMEDGTWKHFEFQSTNEGILGLKRFRNYEATTSYQHGVEVTTYVLYSGKIKNPVTEFTEGINTYRVYPIIMQNKNADELLQKLEDKIKAGGEVAKADLVPLGLTSIMGGESSLKERIVRSYRITQASKGVAAEDINKIEAVIYTMADKFLNELEIEEVQELMAMTKVGQILVNKGKIEGKIEGMVSAYKDIGLSLEDVITKVSERLEKEAEELRDEIIRCWNE